ncbi:MAG: FeoA family protein [bacterium]|jgi:Fe2+ transport system protein FeoA
MVLLSQLNHGEAGQVLEVAVCGTLRRHLLNLGLVPGSTIKMVRRSPLGDPVAYRIRGATLALRKQEADKISIRRLTDEF